MQINNNIRAIILIIILFVAYSINAQQLFPVQNSEGKYGFINAKGSVVINTIYDSAFYFSDGYCCIREGNQWGYIDSLGEMVIQPQFDSTFTFNDGLALVFKDSMAGYIGADGEYKIEPRYFDGMSFSDGMALVKYKEDTWGFIDNQGVLRVKEFPIYEFTIRDYGSEKFYYWPPFFHSGFVSYNQNNSVFLDKKGRKHKYKNQILNDFNISDGVFVAYDDQDKKDYYINKKGKRIISDTYSAISYFIDGYAWVLSCEDDSSIFYYIDKQGEKVDSVAFEVFCPYSSIINLGNGVACTYDYKHTDTRGLIIFSLGGDSVKVCKLPFYYPDNHSDIMIQNTLFLTCIEGGKVYINIKGTVVSKYHIH